MGIRREITDALKRGYRLGEAILEFKKNGVKHPGDKEEETSKKMETQKVGFNNLGQKLEKVEKAGRGFSKHRLGSGEQESRGNLKKTKGLKDVPLTGNGRELT